MILTQLCYRFSEIRGKAKDEGFLKGRREESSSELQLTWEYLVNGGADTALKLGSILVAPTDGVEEVKHLYFSLVRLWLH